MTTFEYKGRKVEIKAGSVAKFFLAYVDGQKVMGYFDGPLIAKRKVKFYIDNPDWPESIRRLASAEAGT